MRSARLVAVALATLVISAAPAVAIATTLVRILDRHPGRVGAVAMLGASLAVAVVGLWPIGERIILIGGTSRFVGAVAAGAASLWFFLRHPVSLLRSGSPAERLMWLLDMEDNARFMGVAREMLAGSPSGGRLASEFGTGFMSSALLLDGAWRGLPVGDPRAAAIDLMNLSVALAIVMIALTVVTVHLTTTIASTERPTGLLRAAADVALIPAVVATAIWVAVAVPMRSGFLSFIWGVVWISLAASIIPLLRRVVRWRKVLLLAVLAAAAVLLIDSWPFLIAGLAPVLALARTRRAGQSPGPSRSIRIGLGSIVLLVAVGLLWNSPVRSVISSVGLSVLEVEGTSITTEPWMRLVAISSVVAGLVATYVSSAERGLARLRDVATATEASAAALGASVVGLFALAVVLNDGDAGYGGRKLLHGAVAVALIVALPATLSRIVASPIPTSIAAGVAGLVVLLSSPVGGFEEQWGTQVDVHLQPHALVVTDALRVTSPELPIRCLPPERTAATPGARWAAYFCVNWVEDAFNEDRIDGYRMDMLTHDDETFDPLIERMMQERMSEYLFAQRIVAGAGWAHWDGIS